MKPPCSICQLDWCSCQLYAADAVVVAGNYDQLQASRQARQVELLHISLLSSQWLLLQHMYAEACFRAVIVMENWYYYGWPFPVHGRGGGIVRKYEWFSTIRKTKAKWYVWCSEQLFHFLFPIRSFNHTGWNPSKDLYLRNFTLASPLDYLLLKKLQMSCSSIGRECFTLFTIICGVIPLLHRIMYDTFKDSTRYSSVVNGSATCLDQEKWVVSKCSNDCLTADNRRTNTIAS